MWKIGIRETKTHKDLNKQINTKTIAINIRYIFFHMLCILNKNYIVYKTNLFLSIGIKYWSF